MLRDHFGLPPGPQPSASLGAVELNPHISYVPRQQTQSPHPTQVQHVDPSIQRARSETLRTRSSPKLEANDSNEELSEGEKGSF